MLEKVKEDQVQGLLLVPDWHGSMMMLEVRETKQLVLEGRICLRFECLSWFGNLTFRGVSKFDMLVFRMRF